MSRLTVHQNGDHGARLGQPLHRHSVGEVVSVRRGDQLQSGGGGVHPEHILDRYGIPLLILAHQGQNVGALRQAAVVRQHIRLRPSGQIDRADLLPLPAKQIGKEIYSLIQEILVCARLPLAGSHVAVQGPGAGHRHIRGDLDGGIHPVDGIGTVNADTALRLHRHRGLLGGLHGDGTAQRLL